LSSLACDMIRGDTNHRTDVFVWDPTHYQPRHPTHGRVSDQLLSPPPIIFENAAYSCSGPRARIWKKLASGGWFLQATNFPFTT
jgi:hypothetical protein